MYFIGGCLGGCTSFCESIIYSVKQQVTSITFENTFSMLIQNNMVVVRWPTHGNWWRQLRSTKIFIIPNNIQWKYFDREMKKKEKKNVKSHRLNTLNMSCVRITRCQWCACAQIVSDIWSKTCLWNLGYLCFFAAQLNKD